MNTDPSFTLTNRNIATRRLFWGCLLVLMMLGLAGRADAATKYALSGRSAELEKIALAQTPAGTVTALDLLMFDSMYGSRLNSVPFDAWSNLDSLEAERHLPAIGETIENMAAWQALSSRAGDWQPPQDYLRVRSFGAAGAVWIQQNVVPQVRVTETDINRYYLANPQKYLRRRRVQVRYILVPANLKDPQAVQQATGELEALAAQIRAGQISFADAAKISSSAPSAKEGGLIPPFFEATHFTAFEEQAFKLSDAGQMSSVFTGPGGVYLLELAQRWEPLNIPIGQVREEISTRLQNEQVRHYFDYLMEQYSRKQLTQNNAFFWQYMNLEAPVAQVNRAKLQRSDFLRYYDNPTDPNYNVRWDVVTNSANDWIQGEMIMQDLEKIGLADAPWIIRARELAAIGPRAQRVMAMEIPADDFRTTESAEATLRGNPEFTKHMREVLVVEIENTQKLNKDMTASEKRAARRLADGLDAQIEAGKLPLEPRPVDFKEWVKTIDPESTPTAQLDTLRESIKETTWPGVRIKITDPVWINQDLDSTRQRQLRGVQVGEVTAPRRIGDTINRYLVLRERPLDVNLKGGRPLALQVLAFQAEVEKRFQNELQRIREGSQIQFLPAALARKPRAAQPASPQAAQPALPQEPQPVTVELK